MGFTRNYENKILKNPITLKKVMGLITKSD
jgi:hypothetical protein